MICRGQTSTARAVFGILIEQLISARRKSAIAIRVILVVVAVGIGMAVSSRLGVCGGTAAIVVAVVLVVVVVHVDSLIGLFVVGSHGKGSLVGINVAVAATEFSVVIARQATVESPVREGIGADEGCTTKKEATNVSFLGKDRGNNRDIKTYQTKTPNATMPLLTLHTSPQSPEEL